MSEKNTAQLIWFSKLGAIAALIALCVFCGGSFLTGELRSFMWGLTAGLITSTAVALLDGYIRRKPLDTSRAAIDAKARRLRRLTFAAIAGGLLASFLIPHLPGITSLAMGFMVGFFAFVAMVLSPLFALRIRDQTPTSPLARMTSMERRSRRNFK